MRSRQRLPTQQNQPKPSPSHIPPPPYGKLP
ncbi:hypothetical protein [Salmonella phage SD-13_S19]|nr:hypothetical protein [Salmonella phage SD-13_S19]